MSKWIATMHKSPSKSGVYIVTIKDVIDGHTYIDLAYYDTEYGWSKFHIVIAWQELPELYKETDNPYQE